MTVCCRPFAPYFAALVGLLLAGCGGESTTTLQGKITHQGKPVTAGVINFQKSGTTLGGAIGADGAYSFALPAGEYQIRIDAPGVTPPWKEGDPEPKPAPRLAPARYASYESSGLTVTVTAESPQQHDIELPK